MERKPITIEEINEMIKSETYNFSGEKIILAQHKNIIDHNFSSLRFDNCDFIKDDISLFDVTLLIKSTNCDFYNCNFSKNIDDIIINTSESITIYNCKNINVTNFVITEYKQCQIGNCNFRNNNLIINAPAYDSKTSLPLYFNRNQNINKFILKAYSSTSPLTFTHNSFNSFSILAQGYKGINLEKIYFHNCQINSLYLVNIKTETISFSNQQNIKTLPQCIDLKTCEIENISLKSSITCKEPISLKIHESKSKSLEIDNLNVQLELTNSTINYSNITLSSIKAKAIKGIGYNNFNISNTCTIEVEDKNDIDTINTLREIFKNNNYHEYLQYNALSQNYLLEDKEGKLKCRDKILLWLNKHSNEFGTNWAKGVLFTVVTGCIFYCIALITHPFVFCFIDKPLPAVNCSQLDRVGMGFIEYITSADLFYSNENSINNTLKQSNFFTLLFYTLGKLSVMYGIYQTIQAFRKYRN